MKEEVGMKRRGPASSLVGLVVAGCVALLGSTAAAQEVDIYRSAFGLSGNISSVALAPVMTDRVPSGPNLSPNNMGQYLMGAYYDVRPTDGDAQINNLQILNSNSNDPSIGLCDVIYPGGLAAARFNGVAGSSCYDPQGGILAKVRFRESKLSREVLDFTIALSCGEVWTANLRMGPNDLPEIRSQMPVAFCENPANFDNLSCANVAGNNLPDIVGTEIRPEFTGGREFFLPSGLTAADVQRGHIEVIGMERLECEPIGGVLDITQTQFWQRLLSINTPGRYQEPSNSLSAELFLVRPASGVSHAYNFDALTNYLLDGFGSFPGQDIFASNAPTFQNCVNTDIAFNLHTPVECVNNANLALAKGRVVGQYDLTGLTNGRTKVVVAFPNKYENCSINVAGTDWSAPLLPGTPFECAAIGEEVNCTIYDRLENFNKFGGDEGGFISPTPPTSERCRLPREVMVIGLRNGPGQEENADLTFDTSSLPAGESGWLELNLARNLSGVVAHSQLFPDTVTQDILGTYVQGYNGLPALALVLQEYSNDSEGGTFGNTVPAAFSSPDVIVPGGS